MSLVLILALLFGVFLVAIIGVAIYFILRDREK